MTLADDLREEETLLRRRFNHYTGNIAANVREMYPDPQIEIDSEDGFAIKLPRRKDGQ